MARYQTRPEPALQRDDVIPTPLDNIQPEESAAAQPAAAAAATSSSSGATSADQPMEVDSRELKRSRNESQGVKRDSDTALEDLQIQPGAASQERFNAMESIPEEVTHGEM
eukprot:3661468-Amphidinium_carterae.1